MIRISVRLQFTPDLLPADIIGTKIYDHNSASFRTVKGPIFSHFVLADEINNLSSLSSSVEYQISIIDQKDYFMMGLVNLWILSGIRTLEDSKIDLNRLENRGIRYLNDKVTEIDVTSKTVTIRGSSTLKLKYDYLIIALGTEYALEEVNGFLENGGFNLYDPDQIPKLRERILS